MKAFKKLNSWILFAVWFFVHKHEKSVIWYTHTFAIWCPENASKQIYVLYFLSLCFCSNFIINSFSGCLRWCGQSLETFVLSHKNICSPFLSILFGKILRSSKCFVVLDQNRHECTGAFHNGSLKGIQWSIYQQSH